MSDTLPCVLTNGLIIQASVGPQESGIARTSSSGGCLVTSTSGGPLVLVSGPPVVPAVSSLPHPSTPVQASRSAASEAQALAQEAAQLKAQAQNFKVSLHCAI